MRILTAAALAAVLPLAACRPAPAVPSPAGRAARPLQVVVSVPPQAYIVERIGGAHVHVEVMIPPGYSHVDYPLSPRKMVSLGHAALYVKVGHPGFEFEHRLDPVLERLPGLRIVDMSRGMHFLETPGVEESGEPHGHEHSGGDSHVWVSPGTVAVAAVNIAQALAEADPAHAAEYRANLRKLQDDIAALDREIRARLGDPQSRGRGGEYRAFLVYHPTWGYFAHEYGLKQIAIESEGREPSAKRLIQLIELARREHVQAIFVQEGFPRKSAQVIAEAVGAEVVTADPQSREWLANLRQVAADLGKALPHG